MKRLLALSGVLAMSGCASVVVGEQMRPVASPQVAPTLTVLTANVQLDDVPLKLMSPSQSAARVN